MPSNSNLFVELLARTPLSQRESRVMCALARKTLGYNKPEFDKISASQLAKLTGLTRPHVTETLRRLDEAKLISRMGGAPGRVAFLKINLEPVPASGHPDLSPHRDTHLSPSPGQEPVPAPGHTRGKGVKQLALRADENASKASLQDLTDAYVGAGGSLEHERARGALKRQGSKLLPAGVDPDLLRAACRSLGREGAFPGLLQQRVKELEADGGPCAWDGFGRSQLTCAQLKECGCRRCGEWAEAAAERDRTDASDLLLAEGAQPARGPHD